MKLGTKILAAVLSALLLWGCAAPVAPTVEPSSGGDVAYSVQVTDANGGSVSGTVVCFYQNGAQVAMQVCDDAGVARKSLPAGTYEIRLQYTAGADSYYNREDLTVSADAPQLTVVRYARASGEQVPINIPQTRTEVDENGLSWTITDTTEQMLYQLNEGCTYVQATPGQRSYYLFMPTRGGQYALSVEDGEGCVFGYYGNPSFIRQEPAQPIVDGVTTVNIENGAVTDDVENTTVLVLGVDSEAAAGCIVRIQRLGDPAWNVSQEDWIVYETTASLSQCSLPEGTTLTNFDLTASYTVVYNEQDGFYHLDSPDGKVIYAYLTRAPRFVDSFQTILENGTVRAYFYDETGNFIKKEAYGQCLREYFPYADAQLGVYPLTKDLKYIIESFGDHQGWWNPNSSGFLLNMENLNAESAWLFMCCYVE